MEKSLSASAKNIKNVHIPKAEVELKVPNIFLQFKIVLHSSFQI